MKTPGPTCKRPDCRNPRSCVHPIKASRECSNCDGLSKRPSSVEDCAACDGSGVIL